LRCLFIFELYPEKIFKDASSFWENLCCYLVITKRSKWDDHGFLCQWRMDGQIEFSNPCTALVVDNLRQRKFKEHRRWMIRSYALTLSAISLRIYQLILGSYFYLDPVVQYVFVSWASWVGNLLFAEFLIYRKTNSSLVTRLSFLVPHS